MNAKEKEYFTNFCGSREYFKTLAFILVVGIVFLSQSLPFMISASICDGNLEMIEQQDVPETYKEYIQQKGGLKKVCTEILIIVKFFAGIIAVSFVIMVIINDAVYSRRIARRMRMRRAARGKANGKKAV